MMKNEYNEQGYTIVEYELNKIESIAVCGTAGITAGLAVYGAVALVRNLLAAKNDNEEEENNED